MRDMLTNCISLLSWNWQSPEGLQHLENRVLLYGDMFKSILEEENFRRVLNF